MTLLARLRHLGIAACLATGGSQAAAADYAMSQTGFSGGGVLSGAFSGADGNGNGQLTLDELLAFDLSFSGDTLVPDLTLSRPDLASFVYQIGGAGLGDDASEGILNLDATFLSGSAVVGSVFTFVDGTTAVSEAQGAITVRALNPSPVPLPPMWALLPLGLLGLATRRRQRSAKAGAGSALPKQSLNVKSSET